MVNLENGLKMALYTCLFRSIWTIHPYCENYHERAKRISIKLFCGKMTAETDSDKS